MIKIPGWLTRRNTAYLIILLAIAGGMTEVVRGLAAAEAKRQGHPYFFGGDMFAPLKGASGAEKYIGYLTDRNINDDQVSMRFTQAQFTLAPVILDFNNPNHRLLILDFQDEKKAVSTGIDLKARPLKRSPQGIIFAERLGL